MDQRRSLLVQQSALQVMGTNQQKLYKLFVNLEILFRISNFATADEFTDTTLRVITIEKRQYGFYTCKAENKFGENEAQVELVGKFDKCLF